ncbi:uncharacterized protein LOC132725481 [Ruditapes philippinarum]|uniref:uncharacterized protein LOC132725481 n=1 Tax=Ruditapes philippinarum TaxID=129788 RepID=UPI00295B1BC9|nr:uncharacterized protein LOC132725481 [Ruditapes philippinarum]
MNAVLEKPILVSLLRDFDLDPPNCPDTEFRDLFKRSPNLLKTFRETKAFTLLKPSEGKVGDLTCMPDEKLCEDFVRVRNELKAYLTAKTKPLRATPHQKMTGIVLAENIQRTVQYINDDDLRMLSKSLPTIFKEKNDAMTGSALDTYRTEMCKNWPLPSQPETLMQLHERTKNVAFEYIDRYCFIIEGSVEIDKEAFTIDIENIFKDIQKDKCKDALLSAICDIENKLKREAYFEIDGLERLFKDYDEAEKAYKEMKNLGPEKLSVWEAYNKEMDTIKDLIKQKVRLIETEHSVADLQMEKRQLNERIEMDRKAFEEKLKEFQNKERNDSVRQMGTGSETSGARSSSPVDGARSSSPDGARSSTPDGNSYCCF